MSEVSAAQRSTIDHLRRHFATIAHGEVERAARRLHIDGDEHRATLNRMADAIVDKLLRAPEMQLSGQTQTHLAAAATKLFALPIGRSATK